MSPRPEDVAKLCESIAEWQKALQIHQEELQQKQDTIQHQRDVCQSLLIGEEHNPNLILIPLLAETLAAQQKNSGFKRAQLGAMYAAIFVATIALFNAILTIENQSMAALNMGLAILFAFFVVGGAMVYVHYKKIF